MANDNRKILLEFGRLKTRIDVVSGFYGAGKTALVNRMLASGGYPADKAAACCGSADAREMAESAERIVGLRRPGRLLLETPGDMLLEEVPDALGSLLRYACIGTLALVIDGRSLLESHGSMREYYIRQLRQARVAFINRAEGLDPAENLEMLRLVWAANRRINLMIEPLSGIDIWRVFDLCAE